MRFEPIDGRRNILGEGPFWDEETQRLYLVDIIGRQVLEYDAAGKETGAWTMPDVVSAAIPRLHGGMIVTLRDAAYFFDRETGGAIRRFSPPDSEPGNRSNEARIDPRGRLWLGTMQDNIGSSGEGIPVERSSGTLSVIDASGRRRRALSHIGISNTLCWSPEGDRLYFADTLAGAIYHFRYDAETATLSDRQIFSDLRDRGSPDGSAIDEHGYLWNARWGGSCIIRFAPDGSVDRVIDLPVRQPTSCVFGGPDRRTLFVTSAANELDDLTPASLDGATLMAETDVRGERCVRFAG